MYLSLRLFFEGDTYGIDAESIPSWGLWGILKHMAEVTAAISTPDLNALHAVASILD
jgi:hypothetical protein